MSTELAHVLGWLRGQPFVLLFLVVAAGYLLGRVKVKGIGLGATASTLLVGLLVSLFSEKLGVSLSIQEFASTVFFNLFMFSVGMKVGPQFLSGLRRDAVNFIILGLLIPALAIGLIFVVRALFDLGPGFVPGVFAGANTATPGLGAADAALASNAATLGPAALADARANMSTAFAFSYCISVVLFAVAMRIPDLLGAKTKASAKAFEAAIRGASDAPLPGAAEEFFNAIIPVTLPVGLRTYQLEQDQLIGKALAGLRASYPMLSVERVLRGDRVLEPADNLVLERNDEVTVYGRISRLITAGPKIGPEVYERVARDVSPQTVDVVVHHKEVAGHTLSELAKDVGHGVYLNAIFRGGEAIPFGPDTAVERGDVLRITGSKWRISILEREVGTVVRASLGTDIVTLALGLALGAAIGALTLRVGSLALTLSSSVGLLLVGIGLSTLRTRHPGFGGPFPEPARQLLEDLGLNVFVAVLGVNAGAGVIHATSQGAVGPIVLGCLIVGFIPPVIGWLVGTRILKMNTALLLGAVAGGRCSSPGMRAATEVAESNVPAISYPVTFAISNVILTLMSYVMAMLETAH